MTDKRAALIEASRNAFIKATVEYYGECPMPMMVGIKAVIAETLEEAAKVAEAFPARTHGNLATAPYAAAEQAGDEIAAAIRAMIPHD